VAPNEHDDNSADYVTGDSAGDVSAVPDPDNHVAADQTAADDSEGGIDEEVADAAGSVTPGTPDANGAGAERAEAGPGYAGSGINGDEGQYDPYLTSGANPFSSVHPTGSGMFPRLQPRQFPPDEPPEDLPVMEQLPDPNALPEPGYPVLAGYPEAQAFPGGQSAFPPGAFPSAYTPETSAYPVEASSSFPSADTSTFRAAAEPQSPQPAEPRYAPQFAQGAYEQSPYTAEPYTAQRSPEAAPPMGPGGHAGARTPYRSDAAAPPLGNPARPAGNGTAPGPEGAAPFEDQADDSQPGYREADPGPGAPAGYPAPPASGPLAAPPFLDQRVAGDPGPAAEPAAPPARETADSLTSDLLLQGGRRPAPGTGWRRTIYRATGGLVRVGESAADLRRRDLINRVRTPVAGGHHRVAVMSLKGGVGKTTTAVGLGSTLASLRGDRVIAMDANPDRGTLSDKVRLETSATVRDLLNERGQVTRYADVRAFTSQAPSRLEILASDRDPGVSVAFSADDYRAVARVLEHYYSISITDCGTGLLHSAMSGILELADHIVLVSSPSVDGARSASATLDWLEAHGYVDLVRSGVVALSTIRPRSKSTVDLDRLEQHFASRCRAVVRIPYDSHLEEGAEVELDMLSSETRDAYLQLAAIVGDGFAMPRRPLSRATPSAPFA
jgi:MinD-like ATPase involved in chromosome partitioning or flagellar assembly